MSDKWDDEEELTEADDGGAQRQNQGQFWYAKPVYKIRLGRYEENRPTFLEKKSRAVAFSSGMTVVSTKSLTCRPSVRWTLEGAGKKKAMKGPMHWMTTNMM